MKAELADPKRDIKAITPEAYARLDSAPLLRGPDDAYSGLAYELAMDVAAGHYAAPYRWLRDASESFRANILFPIVGHLALHCPQPISFFIEFCAYLLRNFDLPATKQIEEAWQQSYAEIFKLAQMLAQARYWGPLWPATVVVEHGPLMEHPGYRAAWLNLTAHMHRFAEGPDRRLIGDGGLGREQRAGLTVDYMLACNGVRKHRTADVLMLTAPPLVRFANGGHWILPDLFQAETDVPIDTGGIDLSLVRRELVAKPDCNRARLAEAAAGAYRLLVTMY